MPDNTDLIIIMHDVNKQTCNETNLVGILIEKHQMREDITIAGQQYFAKKAFPNLGNIFLQELAAFGTPKRQNRSPAKTGTARL